MLPVIVSLLILGKCSQISKRDALLVINMQNDYMEPMLYNHDTIPEYPIPDDQIFERHGHNYTKPGALAVNHTTEIVEPINSLMRHFEQKDAPVILSMNWHPEDHCSFCRNYTHPTEPATHCGPFGRDSKDFNISTACHDRISRKLLKYHMLMQFPDNCIQNEYGSRFSPYLEVSENTTVIKKAFFESFDAFSVWKGAVSNASYPFWNETEQGRDLIMRPSFGRFIKRNKVSRLFIVGVPLDVDVLASSLESLRHKIDEVIVITGLAPGVHNMTIGKAISIMKKAGVKVVPCNATKIDDILDSVCSPDDSHPHPHHPHHPHHHRHPHHRHYPRPAHLSPQAVIADESTTIGMEDSENEIEDIQEDGDDGDEYDHRHGHLIHFSSDWRWFAVAYAAVVVPGFAYVAWRYTHRPRIVVGNQYNAIH